MDEQQIEDIKSHLGYSISYYQSNYNFYTEVHCFIEFKGLLKHFKPNMAPFVYTKIKGQEIISTTQLIGTCLN